MTNILKISYNLITNNKIAIGDGSLWQKMVNGDGSLWQKMVNGDGSKWQ